MNDNPGDTVKEAIPEITIQDSPKPVEEKKDEVVLTPKDIERMKRADFLGNAPIGQTIWKMTYPDFIAKILGALYNIVDSMFIGKYAGDTVEETKNALAGVSLASPIEMCLLVGMSLIFAQGGGPLYGQYLGKKDIDGASRIIGNTFFMDICLGILVAIVFPFIARPLLIILGASNNAGTLQPGLDYILPLMYCDILYNVCYACNNLMRGEGAAIFTCILMMISSCTNMLFDFILLRFFHMGTRGAALATGSFRICIFTASITALTKLLFVAIYTTSYYSNVHTYISGNSIG